MVATHYLQIKLKDKKHCTGCKGYVAIRQDLDNHIVRVWCVPADKMLATRPVNCKSELLRLKECPLQEYP